MRDERSGLERMEIQNCGSDRLTQQRPKSFWEQETLRKRIEKPWVREAKLDPEKLQ